jgi:hypothetical protein
MSINDFPNAKIIKGFTGYAVTSCGKVLSLPRTITTTHPRTKQPVKHTYKEVKVLKPSVGSHGSFKVELCQNGKRKTCYVKNLVAEAFCFKPKGVKNLIVWHLDEDKTNCSADNLDFIPFAKLCLLTNSHEYRMNFKN